jgi:type IV pilus assembly protein PilA
MSEAQKKTLGMAIASLVFGCLVLIPILGIPFAITAIVLGIIALNKISNNKDTLQGKGLAISGIVLGGIGIILIPIIAMLAAIAIPNLLRARLNANEANAQATLKTLTTAAESYAAVNNGEYPSSARSLTIAEPPYLNENYTSGTYQGYKFSCEFDSNNYECIATPTSCDTTGTKIYTIEKKGMLSEADCTK